jgi:predicted house-cleaning noncanonical NTP pyrophosphatase (MazG superfamily)
MMKLVRDRIPEIIEESGKTCKCSVIDEIGEFQERLFEKMQEEMMEFFENPCLEEAADMYEVLKTITWLHRIGMEEVVDTARHKAVERGGFYSGIVLEEID